MKQRNKPTNYETKFQVRIEEKILVHFTKKAKEQGHNRSSLIRNWIYEYIDKEIK